MSFRVDLEIVTQGLRVGVRVKASSLEKARVPAGTVRLLELFFRGNVSVRAELRNEFPFVATVSSFIFCFPPSHLLSLPYFCISLPLATQIGGHRTGTPPPSPLPCTCRVHRESGGVRIVQAVLTSALVSP